MNTPLAPLHRITRACAWVGGIALLACALLISLDLILRKVFGISMGGADEMTCPYCSTLYRFDPALGALETRPADALFVERAA